MDCSVPSVVTIGGVEAQLLGKVAGLCGLAAALFSKRALLLPGYTALEA